ncbi:MAG: CotH kinase family protein [Saprospiraceae bacterium]
MKFIFQCSLATFKTMLNCFVLISSISLFGQQFQSSNLPILIINTNGISIPNEPKIVGTLEIIYNGPGKINLLTDAARDFKGKIGVELHGSSSLDLSPKKPLGIETRMDDGVTNLNVSLLGLPKENDWILLAPYSDKSLIRDVLIHRIGAEVLPYSSRTRLCELLINGQYAGVYVLMEKIKRDKNRVNIPELTALTNSGDALTGGYILKIDKTTGSTPQGGFTSTVFSGNAQYGRKTYYQYEEPEANVITTAQKKYIGDLVLNFEASFNKNNYKDPKEGFRKYVEENSMVDFLILNELANNVDGYRLSTFLYKDVDSKSTRFRVGPIWDFNLGFGNADYCQGGLTNVLALEFALRCPMDNWTVPFYWPIVFQDSAFDQHLYDRWTSLRKGLLTNNHVMFLIDSLTGLLTEAAPRNFQKWNILNQYVWPNAYVGGSYANEIKYLKDWVITRMAFLDGIIKQLIVPKYYQERYFTPIIFPNPATHDQPIKIKYYNHDSDRMHLEIYDMVGHFLTSIKDIDHFNGVNQLQTSTIQLPSGVYFYKLLAEYSPNAWKVGKIIVR